MYLSTHIVSRCTNPRLPRTHTHRPLCRLDSYVQHNQPTLSARCAIEFFGSLRERTYLLLFITSHVGHRFQVPRLDSKFTHTKASLFKTTNHHRTAVAHADSEDRPQQATYHSIAFGIEGQTQGKQNYLSIQYISLDFTHFTLILKKITLRLRQPDQSCSLHVLALLRILMTNDTNICLGVELSLHYSRHQSRYSLPLRRRWRKAQALLWYARLRFRTSLSNICMLIFRETKRFVPLGIKQTYNGGGNRT